MPPFRHGAEGKYTGWCMQHMPIPLIPIKLRRYLCLDGTKLSAYRRMKRPTDTPLWTIELAGSYVEPQKKDSKICIAIASGEDIESEWGGSINLRNEGKLIFENGWKRFKRQGMKLYIIECLSEKDLENWCYRFRKASRSIVENHYEMERVIDMGSFATVVLGREIRNGKQVAIKLIEKRRLPQRQRIYVERELKIVRKLNHENVVKTFDVFDTEARARIVMEFAGTTLTKLLEEQGRLDENNAKVVMRGILGGVEYLHSIGIVHRDLSATNILLLNLSCPKISDFGLSTFFKDHMPVADDVDINETKAKLLKSACGTTLFMAPEVLARKPYGCKVDLWSVGVILFYLIAGELPFDGSTLTTIVTKVRQGSAHASANSTFWKEASREVKDLLYQLLRLDPRERISASNALRHPWFRDSHLG